MKARAARRWDSLARQLVAVDMLMRSSHVDAPRPAGVHNDRALQMIHRYI